MKLKDLPRYQQALGQCAILLLCALTAVGSFLGALLSPWRFEFSSFSFVSKAMRGDEFLVAMFWLWVAVGIYGIWRIAGLIYELSIIKRLWMSALGALIGIGLGVGLFMLF